MKVVIAVLFIISAIFLGACLGSLPVPGGNDQPVASLETPVPTDEATPNVFEYGEAAYSESIDTVFLESFPLQVHAVVKGNLPDGCTTIQRHEVKRKGNLFTIKIFTQRQKDAICTQALVPFEYIIPLDVYNLPAGKYMVKANEISTEFSFSQDNVPQESSGG
jgi:inhibitor of cysteine peptidase